MLTTVGRDTALKDCTESMQLPSSNSRKQDDREGILEILIVYGVPGLCCLLSPLPVVCVARQGCATSQKDRKDMRSLTFPPNRGCVQVSSSVQWTTMVWPQEGLGHEANYLHATLCR